MAVQSQEGKRREKEDSVSGAVGVVASNGIF